MPSDLPDVDLHKKLGMSSNVATTMSGTQIKTESSNKSFQGTLTKYSFSSKALGGLTTNVNVFLPAGAKDGAAVPVLYYLAGLTCTEGESVQLIWLTGKTPALKREASLAMPQPATSHWCSQTLLLAAQESKARTRIGISGLVQASTSMLRATSGPSTTAWRNLSSRSYPRCSRMRGCQLFVPRLTEVCRADITRTLPKLRSSGIPWEVCNRHLQERGR